MKNDPHANAFRFEAAVQFAPTAPAEAGPRKITGIAYSGDVLSHPSWPAVVFDLATTTAPERIPVLVDHDRGKRAGVAQMRITPDRIEIANGTLLQNETGAQVAADADAGFPWQLSVHIEPREIQSLAAGESAVVNGRKVEGPACVFRNSTLREVSLTPTGVDHNTSAAVFSGKASARATLRSTGTAESVDPYVYAAAIRAEQHKAAQAGERITVLDAVQRLRAVLCAAATWK